MVRELSREELKEYAKDLLRRFPRIKWIYAAAFAAPVLIVTISIAIIVLSSAFSLTLFTNPKIDLAVFFLYLVFIFAVLLFCTFRHGSLIAIGKATIHEEPQYNDLLLGFRSLGPVLLLYVKIGLLTLGWSFLYFFGYGILVAVGALLHEALAIIFALIGYVALIILEVRLQIRYQFAPYAFAANPTLHSSEAIDLSKRIAHGRYGEICVLNLSFIGWMMLANLVGTIAGGILGVLSFGVLMPIGILLPYIWLYPYMEGTLTYYFRNRMGLFPVPPSSENPPDNYPPAPPTDYPSAPPQDYGTGSSYFGPEIDLS